MKAVESFLLLCSFQAILFTTILLIFVLAYRFIFRKRTASLISCGLIGLVGLWLIAMLPIDGWVSKVSELPVVRETILSESTDVQAAGVDQSEPLAGVGNEQLPSSQGPSLLFQSTLVEYARATWGQLQSLEPLETATAESNLGISWKSWLVYSLLLAIGIGFIRLFISCWTIHRLQSQSTVLSDRQEVELLDVVRARLCCRREIELRESSATNAAFTVGWLRPKICLSLEWESWKPEELEATLAHEVAHVISGDFMQRVIAQFATALNFYNPIVHYLCRLLCVDQEYNADEQASTIVGGRKTYLNTIALMALDSDFSNHRLAPMFLPTRKTFFWRIEMLRSKKTGHRESWLGKTTGILLLVVLVTFVAGIRFPGRNLNAATRVAAAVAPRPLVEFHSSPEGFRISPNAIADANLRYVPANAKVVMVFRPNQLLQTEAGQKLRQNLKRGDTDSLDDSFEDLFALKAMDVDQLTVFFTGDEPDFSTTGFVVQTVNDGWWAGDESRAEMSSKLELKRNGSFRDQTVFRSDSLASPQSLYSWPDSKTLVVAQSSDDVQAKRMLKFKAALRSNRGPDRSWVNSWKEFADHSMSCAVTGDYVDLVGSDLNQSQGMFFPVAAEILEKSRFAIMAGDLKPDSIEMKVRIACDVDGLGQGAVKDVSELATVVLKLANLSLKKVQSSDMFAIGVNHRALLKLARQMLNDVEIESDDQSVLLATAIKSTPVKVVNILAPAFKDINEAAMRTESMNNLRLLQLAILNYESVHLEMPPAVLTSEHGTKYSWRVAILPYLDQNEIYKRYRFDEDWNSEHNLKVAKEIPSMFQHPKAKLEKSPYCSYFLITGKGTAYEAGQPVKLGGIVDGTSNTISTVEAKQEVTWTQPKDIVFKNDELDVQPGGFSSGGFNASLFDGSVRFFSDNIEKKTMSMLYQCADGQAVPSLR